MSMLMGRDLQAIGHHRAGTGLQGCMAAGYFRWNLKYINTNIAGQFMPPYTGLLLTLLPMICSMLAFSKLNEALCLLGFSKLDA